MNSLFASTFGSEAGGWGYPYVQPLSAATFLVPILLIPILLVLAYVSGPLIQRHQWKLVALWMVVGFAAQLCLRCLAPYAMGEIIESPAANSFYTVTQQHSAGEFLTQFHALVGSLPMHARANMPGKTLLYYLLETITASTEMMGVLIILTSNVGGVLTYLLAKRSFQCQLTALYAMIFYLFMPAKMYFFPILNTVTPVLMLLSLLLLAIYLASKQDRYLLALGAALYGLLLFEPLPFVTGLIFLAMIGKHLAEGDLNRLHAIKILAYVPGAFFLTHFLLVATVGFNIITAFCGALEDARAFNESAHRPYGVWVVENLKDFFLNMGIAQSLLFFCLLGGTLWKLAALVRQRTGTGNDLAAFLMRTDVVLLLAFSSVLLVLDIFGINRGETIRLWIFLGVIMQIVVAHACAVGRRFAGFALVLGVTIFQTALCLTRVGFVMP